jgi:hypothetical protein
VPLQAVRSTAGQLFSLLQPLVSSADGATLASITHSCKDLALYSKTLLTACLARAKTLLQQQQQGGDGGVGFSGRRLGVMMHGLAVLGLRPSDDWLRLAVTVAGETRGGRGGGSLGGWGGGVNQAGRGGEGRGEG